MENLQRKRRKLSKKKEKSATEYFYVPEDLLIEIFSRVPSKSIARFRCVSKLWGFILRRPDFTELFLTRSSCQPRILFSFKVDEKLFFYSSPQPQNPDKGSSVVATRYNGSFPQYVPSEYQNMLSGLVLHHGYRSGRSRGKVRVICNPATGEYLTLPKLLLKDKTLPKVKARIEGIYFGYDPFNKQFKVLCMTSSTTHQVLTLEPGKRLWRRIKSDFSFRGLNYVSEICIKGVLYFIFSTSRSFKISCFDVRTEKFSLINLDKVMLKRFRHSISATTLVNYKGKLGVHYIKRWGKMDFDLWVLEEDAGNHKWSKLIYRFRPSWNNLFDKKCLHIIGMTRTGEMVCAPHRLSKAFSVFYYNFERKTFRRVKIQGFEEFKQKHITVLHTFLDYSENMKLFK